ncbi:Trp biosynthesis-associated membrane protein [Humibacillus xanthopallidus]|uniref:Tryptophan-associated transmembrane protein n=1 Tax=Humibacillus xanthopallidus TaxID=412689 RepID=A0A543HIX0_9MICO|nr:Trp biosynthesis-associated membrane protein [Humibacillus xanthopallidus]TQM58288.1 tryptophan-associated transmembrane protein [Humibacillus xanthopallidus]
MTLSKRYAALAVLVPAALALLLTTRPWAVGESRDVLSAGTTEVTGGAAAPGVVGLVVVTVVALLGLMTGGRIIRAVSAVVLVLAAAGAAALTLLVVLRPVDAVSAAVAKELARTTAPDATGATTFWGWAGAVVSVALLAGAVAAALSSRSWAGLSSRYERGSRPESGPRGQVRSAWDELSDGGDPTLRDSPEQT